MTKDEVFCNTFRAMRHELGHDVARDMRPLWERRLSTASVFCRSLVTCGYLTEEQMQRAAKRYHLGMSRDGGVIFWQIDERELLRDGKIMYYHPDCHRDHDRKPTWTNHLLRRCRQVPEDWQPEHCLFGLHLIRTPSNSPFLGGEHKSSLNRDDLGGSAIAIVESEKTAVIMSEVKPEYLWLATGGKTELSVAKLKPLAGRRVILFPDTDETGDTYRDWYEVAEAASDVFGHPVTVSSLLEQRATKAQKAAKIDIVDLIYEERYGNNELSEE